MKAARLIGTIALAALITFLYLLAVAVAAVADYPTFSWALYWAFPVALTYRSIHAFVRAAPEIKTGAILIESAFASFGWAVLIHTKPAWIG